MWCVRGMAVDSEWDVWVGVSGMCEGDGCGWRVGCVSGWVVSVVCEGDGCGWRVGCVSGWVVSVVCEGDGCGW